MDSLLLAQVTVLRNHGRKIYGISLSMRSKARESLQKLAGFGYASALDREPTVTAPTVFVLDVRIQTEMVLINPSGAQYFFDFDCNL